MSLVNVLFKLLFLRMTLYMLIFLLKECEKLLTFFSKNTCELNIVLSRTVNILTTNELVKLTMLWTTGPRFRSMDTICECSCYCLTGYANTGRTFSCPSYTYWYLGPCVNSLTILIHCLFSSFVPDIVIMIMCKNHGHFGLFINK